MSILLKGVDMPKAGEYSHYRIYADGDVTVEIDGEERIIGAASEVPDSRWIPVTERLPEIGKKVLAIGKQNKGMYAGTYNGGRKETEHRKANPYMMISGGSGWHTIKLWMPLPEPPKEE